MTPLHEECAARGKNSRCGRVAADRFVVDGKPFKSFLSRYQHRTPYSKLANCQTFSKNTGPTSIPKQISLLTTVTRHSQTPATTRT